VTAACKYECIGVWRLEIGLEFGNHSDDRKSAIGNRGSCELRVASSASCEFGELRVRRDASSATGVESLEFGNRKSEIGNRKQEIELGVGSWELGNRKPEIRVRNDAQSG